MKKLTHLFALSLCLLMACRKKDFPPDTRINESGFAFSADIDGQRTSLSAGEADYYMFASYTTDTTLKRFIAELKPRNCNAACGNSIKFIFNDYRRNNLLLPSPIDSSFRIGSVPFGVATGYAVSFKSSFNKQASTYLWNFGDNSTSTEANPTHVYTSAGNYSVSLRIRSNANCEQYISNIERIKSGAEFYAIRSQTITTNTIRFLNNLQDTLINSCAWYFGDGTSSTANTPAHTYSVAGTYPVVLKVFRGQKQDTITSHYNVATVTNPMPCISNYSIQTLNYFPGGLFSGVNIVWTDANGDQYSSEAGSQPLNSQFTIVSVENYELNERGEKTKKLKVRFDCTVFKGSLSKRIQNAEAIICIAYP